MRAGNRPKIISFRFDVLPFYGITQNGTAHGPSMPRRAGFFWCDFLIYVGFGIMLEHYFFVFE